jgi:hypothetical protein
MDSKLRQDNQLIFGFSMQERYFRQMVIISGIMVLATTFVVFLNVRSPGLCPEYPVIGLPACMVVAIYFIAILASLFFKSRAANLIFYLATSLAFLTSIYFSVKEITGMGSCPRLFDIPLPLCFIVFPTMALLAHLKYHGSKDGNRKN